jgi:hypothetical protein
MSETMFTGLEAWKAERIGKFTSSEIYKLLKSGRGKDQYFGEVAMTYIIETVGEVVTGEIPEVSAKAIDWGYANEYDAVLEYEKKIGVKAEYFGCGNPKFIPYNEVAGGSPDGLVGEKIVLEVKCPFNSGNHINFLMMEKAEQLKVENFNYYCQIQMNLLCTKRDLAHFISYDPRVIDHRLRLAILEVARDEEIIKEIEERIKAATVIVKNLLSKLAA